MTISKALAPLCVRKTRTPLTAPFASPSSLVPSRVTLPSTPGTRRFFSRMLAKVPRTITSWFPRRAPYELKSFFSTPCAINHFPAGLEAGMLPAGEM